MYGCVCHVSFDFLWFLWFHSLSSSANFCTNIERIRNLLENTFLSSVKSDLMAKFRREKGKKAKSYSWNGKSWYFDWHRRRCRQKHRLKLMRALKTGELHFRPAANPKRKQTYCEANYCNNARINARKMCAQWQNLTATLSSFLFYSNYNSISLLCLTKSVNRLSCCCWCYGRRCFCFILFCILTSG